jgi:hypothetical protein
MTYIEGDIILKTGPKPQATWSFDPNFYVRFEVGHKKPHLIARFLQRWLLGIYWRDVP